MFKLIFIPIGVVIIYTIIMFLIPIFQFAGFVGDGYNEVQNIFQEMEKYIEEYKDIPVFRTQTYGKKIKNNYKGMLKFIKEI